MPMGNSTEYGGVLPGTPHSSLPWDLSLTLSNRYITDTAKIEKGEESNALFPSYQLGKY